MVESARDRFIETTRDLLESQGYHATGLSQIISGSGAPKGSLYHYFPKGKEELTEEAIMRTAEEVADRIRDTLAGIADPVEAVRAFVLRIAHHAEASGFRAGGPLTTVALETASTSERLNAACRAAYESWQRAFASKLRASGYPKEQARHLSVVIIAMIEGAIILSRTFHSREPFERVAAEMASLLHLPPGATVDETDR